jgi:hypothetical protein
LQGATLCLEKQKNTHAWGERQLQPALLPATTLKRGKRIDMYKVFVDGVPWKHCGLSAVLAGIRKATPRLIGALQ